MTIQIKTVDSTVDREPATEKTTNNNQNLVKVETTTQDKELVCQCLDASYIEECSLVMAKAFVDSPAYRFIFQDCVTEEDRIQALQWLLSKNLMAEFNKCDTLLRGILDPNDGSVVCCFLWVPKHKPTLWEMIMAGTWQIPFRFGWKTFQRLLAVVDEMADHDDDNGDEHEHEQDETKNKHDGDETTKTRSIQLQRMVVRPDMQGQGYGSRALEWVFREEEEDNNKHSPWQVRLTTQEERNVRFYQRLGFQVVGEQDCFTETDQDYHFHNWFMVRTSS